MDRSNLWLVILGSLLSIVSSAITTWLAHQENLRRESGTRAHARRVQIIDLQANVLLQLQDAMTELMAASMAEWEIQRRQDHEAYPTAANRSLLARAVLSKLIVRVWDGQVKDLALDFNNLALSFSFPDQPHLYNKNI